MHGCCHNMKQIYVSLILKHTFSLLVDYPTGCNRENAEAMPSSQYVRLSSALSGGEA